MMKNPFPLFPFLLITTLFLLSCSGNEENKTITATDTIANDTAFIPKEHPDSARAAILKTVPKDAKEIFGYRFIIKGDFNGDGKQETLTEHYINTITNKESAKFYDSTVTYDQLIALTYQKHPHSFFTSSDKKTDTLEIEQGEQLLGISFMRNEGDLDGDGGDELSYVTGWLDWSSMNSVRLYTYKNSEWKEYLSFEINETDLLMLPENNPASKNTVANALTKYYYSESENTKLANDLKNFPGFITKLGNGKIKIRTYSAESGDYIFREIDLSKLER